MSLLKSIFPVLAAVLLAFPGFLSAEAFDFSGTAGSSLSENTTFTPGLYQIVWTCNPVASGAVSLSAQLVNSGAPQSTSFLFAITVSEDSSTGEVETLMDEVTDSMYRLTGGAFAVQVESSNCQWQMHFEKKTLKTTRTVFTGFVPIRSVSSSISQIPSLDGSLDNYVLLKKTSREARFQTANVDSRGRLKVYDYRYIAVKKGNRYVDNSRLYWSYQGLSCSENNVSSFTFRNASRVDVRVTQNVSCGKGKTIKQISAGSIYKVR